MNASKVDNDRIVKMEELLRTIRPEPGEAYLQRMMQAPWKSIEFSGFKAREKKYRLVFGAVIVTLIAIFMLATPAGSVFADQILRFFTRAQKNALLAPTELISTLAPTRTPEPPLGLALVPADQVVKPLPSIAPTVMGVPQQSALTEAELAAGFNLYEPLRLPRDYNLIRVSYDETRQGVYMEYKSPQAGTNEFFYIFQGRNLEPFEIGASAKTETVQIGDYSAEIVRGSWFTPAGSIEQIWVNTPETYFLRWQAADVYIEMGFLFNETFMPVYLTRDEILTLARELVRCPSAEIDSCDGSHVIPGRQPTPTEADDRVAYVNVAEVESLAGFDVLEPGLIPEGLLFSHARFSPSGKFVWLDYGDFADDLIHFRGPTLRISQLVRQSASNISSDDYPPEAVENVVVNGYPGIITFGRLFTNAATPGQPTPGPIWQSETGDIAVKWMTETMVYFISFTPGYPGSERLSKQNLIRIAESLH